MLDVLSTETMYVAASAVIAVSVWLEAMMLRRNAGKLPDSSLFFVASGLGSLWVLVSAVAVYFLEFDDLTICVPVAYGLYTVLNWIYSAKVLSGDSFPDNPNDIVLPPKLLSFSQSFAVVFFGLCMLVLFRPESLEILLIQR